MHVSAVMRPLQKEQRAYVDKHFLPNRLQPSDHLPLGCILHLRPSANSSVSSASMQQQASLELSDYGDSDDRDNVPATHPPAPAEHPTNGLASDCSDSRPSLVMQPLGDNERAPSR